ncbi:MAG: type II toxin-antitoxin system YafQ family toxin [Candidatus Paceibacterota bacterium]|jgi:addiction module RelE/StbE family toxin
MKKIVGFILHKNFEKSYPRQNIEVKKAFIERRNLLLIDQQHHLLNNHSLQGKWVRHRSINITGNIRAVYKMEGFFAIFIEIGTHSQLYG